MKTSKSNLNTLAQIFSFSVVFTFAAFAIAGIANADILNRQLEEGNSGTDVSALQAFLAKDVTLYPQGLVTGYFGMLTKAAVSNFQSRNGISAVGRVGPQTLPVLNAQMAGGMSDNAGAPIITSIGVNVNSSFATVNWYTNEPTKGIVYYSTSPLSMNESANNPSISGTIAMTDTNLRASQAVSVQGLSANTMYYYLIHTTDQAGNVSVTWPSTFRTTN